MRTSWAVGFWVVLFPCESTCVGSECHGRLWSVSVSNLSCRTMVFFRKSFPKHKTLLSIASIGVPRLSPLCCVYICDCNWHLGISSAKWLVGHTIHNHCNSARHYVLLLCERKEFGPVSQRQHPQQTAQDSALVSMNSRTGSETHVGPLRCGSDRRLDPLWRKSHKTRTCPLPTRAFSWKCLDLETDRPSGFRDSKSFGSPTATVAHHLNPVCKWHARPRCVFNDTFAQSCHLQRLHSKQTEPPT